MKVRLAQLDTALTAADPDGPGGAPAGYDSVFREPVKLPPGNVPGATNRVEVLSPFLLAQVEVARWDEQRQGFAGNLPAGSLNLVFHFRDLEALGMLDANGVARIRVGDRLEGVYDPGTEVLIQRPTTPLYAVEPRSSSFGLDGLTRNLLVVAFAPRDAGTMGGV